GSSRRIRRVSGRCSAARPRPAPPAGRGAAAPRPRAPRRGGGRGSAGGGSARRPGAGAAGGAGGRRCRRSGRARRGAPRRGEPRAVVLATEVVCEALDRPALGDLAQPIGRARLVIGVGPGAINVGELVQAVSIAPRLLGDVVVVVGVALDPGTDDDGLIDTV